MRYGSPFYILMLALLVFFVIGAYLLLRHRSEAVKKAVIFSLMAVNVIQHLFKWAIYPMYEGMSFNILSTAYNVCAFMILCSPIALLSHSDFLKNLVFPVGTVAGLIANVVPYWYIGMNVSELGWEYARFYICHAILFVTSILVLMLGLHRPAFRKFWQPGLGFLFALAFILINDVIALALGIFDGYDISDAYGALLGANPCFSMGPPDDFAWIADISAVFTPSLFLGNNKTGLYTPIVWYAVPVFLGISLCALIMFSFFDKEGKKKATERITMLFGKISFFLRRSRKK